MPQTSISSSAGLAKDGVNVTFINGVVSGGTTITATKYTQSRPQNSSFGLPQGLNSVKNLYYTVTSSVANPGEYVIVLDFSGLGLSEAEWGDARVVKTQRIWCSMGRNYKQSNQS
ncbi:MAG: hypothetical protein NVV59_07240 [Chitinophagaceae bacterium]|nr:hypothetical protein [Chitinophagaceae bacterium]